MKDGNTKTFQLLVEVQGTYALLGAPVLQRNKRFLEGRDRVEIKERHSRAVDGFGGLVVACWPLAPKPLDFYRRENPLSMPSSGGEVKESVPCPSFAACKRT